MKKLLLIAAVFLLIQKWDVIDGYFNPRSQPSAGQSAQVTLYATTWCGYCAKTREFFAEHDVPYTEYDIERSEEGKAQYLALGKNGVPVVVIDGQLIHGYNPKVMSDLLRL